METRRTTAPLPKIKTVLVDSEKGSRLSLPATVRAPFTVTATSSATGCGRGEVSLCAAVEPAEEGEVLASGIDARTWLSFTTEDMGHARGDRLLRRSQKECACGFNGMFLPEEGASYSTDVLRERKFALKVNGAMNLQQRLDFFR